MKTMIVTGASAGIGLAVAQTMLDAGWTVGLIARRAAPLQALADRHGPRAIPLPLDVTDADAVQSAFHHFAASTGRLDTPVQQRGRLHPDGRRSTKSR